MENLDGQDSDVDEGMLTQFAQFRATIVSTYSY
jgi:hypothetical protein